MEISRALQAELQKRDDTILALEMLTVDQACRLLALESILVSLPETRNVALESVKARIRQEAKRFQDHFEGSGLTGFVDRAVRTAEALVSGATPSP